MEITKVLNWSRTKTFFQLYHLFKKNDMRRCFEPFLQNITSLNCDVHGQTWSWVLPGAVVCAWDGFDWLGRGVWLSSGSRFWGHLWGWDWDRPCGGLWGWALGGGRVLSLFQFGRSWVFAGPGGCLGLLYYKLFLYNNCYHYVDNNDV